MPPRSRSGTPEHLTAENLETLAAAVAEGKRATVYLREATPSLGIEAGCSAKVVSVEGKTVVIRPKGVNDELPFEAEELRMTRIAPEPVASPKSAARPAAQRKPTPGPDAGASAPTSAPKSPSKPAASTSAPKSPSKPAASTSAPKSPPKPAASTQAAISTATPNSRRGKKAPNGVSVTIHAGSDNDWTVTVVNGAKRPGKGVPVTAEAVDRAVRELGEPTVIEAVQSVISAAREAAEQRIATLSKELDEARRALEALGATS
ncbi:translation initiation factor [Rhodococcus xishaensis]|uniref:Translation initiation factor n=1 Tax=Rhodococcus xishaensis TaxID=2487364 RepID=A0A3S3B2W9_9NOCA|nr:translation initiation factor [Rhodococcus xishaensis]RVW01887.1 translation initiation factor [Rhodococcus xishaensis]